ncbi:2-phosphosulfolactate phosphatase [Salimicrobium humidisoli]|uniref:Probable 2-phosphosulfolactate phosphatase n=1 Tax=Salimicrobium humidisoli TaxID=2029857 RepID=A0ABX4HQK6_9BACI|nr:2-phosphosulfolactate phosphatase [Salimicrobium humidisoli]PBB04990.1 2-phosphosulfolactate phosphatase [Salimicrobium humidisoli]
MKIHLLWKKEEIEERHINEDKIAVVFDVLLATSTIASCLAAGAREIIPVLNTTEALRTKEKLSAGTEEVLLAGETDGLPVEGFINPVPSILNRRASGKTVILSTTNGTVAIRKAASAKKVYTASLLNGEAVGKRIAGTHEGETVVAICSGSRNNFCMEDYYGAGYFIHCLMRETDDPELTDSARSAQLFYENMKEEAVSVLTRSSVGRMLSDYGFYEDVAYVSQRGIMDVVPRLNGAGTVLMDERDSASEHGPAETQRYHL